MNSIECLNKNECCGCSACFQKCPKNAITMEENQEGFLYPVVDENKCINCGLCKKVCPQLNNYNKKNTDYPKSFAMYNTDTEELLQSSSGGIFSVLARYILEESGTVYGAAYDSNLNVNHIKITSLEELNLLRGSKYVQSNINDTYKLAEQDLKLGKKVLFSGTPCQIAGLKNYLIKEYEELYTCDLVCHGVPSQKLFHKYLDGLSKKLKSKVVKYNFRYKKDDYWGLLSEVVTQDGKKHILNPDFDPYYSNFLESTTYRENCYSCKYANYNRVSDITLADYWGIATIHPDFYKKEGCSLILINSLKGEKILRLLDNKIKRIPTNLDFASEKNKNLKRPSVRNKRRDVVYLDIDKLEPIEYIKERLKVRITLKKIIKKCIPNKILSILKKMKGKMKNDKNFTFCK